jgi:hypothetical protein
VRAEAGFRLRRQLGREGRCRAQQEIGGGKLFGFGQQYAQVHRGDHQAARPRQRSQPGSDVGRVERAAGVQRKAPLHHHQHGGFKAEDVLRRDRADKRDARARAQLEDLDLCKRDARQAAPGLAVGDRLPGRARGKDDRRHLRRRHLRYTRRSRSAGEPLGESHRSQGSGRLRRIVKAIHIGILRRNPRDDIGCLVRRQQADLFAQQRRREADGKAVPVGAQIQDVAPCGKRAGNLRDVAQEGFDRHGAPVAVGECGAWRKAANQRKRRRGHAYSALMLLDSTASSAYARTMRAIEARG